MTPARTYCNGPICRVIRSLQQQPANPDCSDNEDVECYSAEEDPLGEEESDRYLSKSSDDEATIFTPISDDASDVSGQNDNGGSSSADSEVESSGADGDNESRAEDESEEDEQAEEDDDDDDDDHEEREEDAKDESEDDDDDDEKGDEDGDDDDMDDKGAARPQSDACRSTCFFIDLENGSSRCSMHCVAVQTGSLLSICEDVHEPNPVEGTVFKVLGRTGTTTTNDMIPRVRIAGGRMSRIDGLRDCVPWKQFSPGSGGEAPRLMMRSWKLG